MVRALHWSVIISLKGSHRQTSCMASPVQGFLIWRCWSVRPYHAQRGSLSFTDMISIACEKELDRIGEWLFGMFTTFSVSVTFCPGTLVLNPIDIDGH